MRSIFAASRGSASGLAASFARDTMLGIAIVAVAAVFAPLHAQSVGLPVGTVAPAAAVQTLDGKPVDLKQYIGKVPVVIEFWATWCPNCEELEPTFKALAAKYGERVKLLGVAVSVNQSPARVKAYAQKHALPLEVLWDHDGNATDVYSAPATSYVVIIDTAGKVVYTGLGGKQDLDAVVAKLVK
jgi:thiol-disulfide isomerase/thioredoxin